jgi:hypothetical protein
LRLAATRNLVDQNALFELAANSRYPRVREAAISRLTDPIALRLLAEDPKIDPSNRTWASDMLTDPVAQQRV